jgi:tetratricopeptide (TPR) repeat protein
VPRPTLVSLPLLLVAVRLSAQPPTGPGAARADSLFFADQWAEAKAAYDQFLRVNPSSTQAALRAGYAALKLARPAEAVPYFEDLVRRAPSGRAPFALAGLAVARAQQGDRDGSFQYLDRAVAAGYGNVTLLDRDEWFQPLRGDPRFTVLRDKAEAQGFPCLADQRSRGFDFWIGEWDAYVNGTAQLAGKSRIDRISGGCGILENWSSRQGLFNGGYEGKSLNFFDAATGKWRQVWAGSSQDVGEFGSGEYRDGAMRFTYHRTTPQGQKVEGDFIFYNLGPNKVRQFQDQTSDGGKTRQVVYDFLYIRVGSGESPLSAGRP